MMPRLISSGSKQACIMYRIMVGDFYAQARGS